MRQEELSSPSSEQFCPVKIEVSQFSALSYHLYIDQPFDPTGVEEDHLSTLHYVGLWASCGAVFESIFGEAPELSFPLYLNC